MNKEEIIKQAIKEVLSEGEEDYQKALDIGDAFVAKVTPLIKRLYDMAYKVIDQTNTLNNTSALAEDVYYFCKEFLGEE